MPSYAFLQTSLHCPSCAAYVHDEVWFQWGFCAGRAPRPESTYRVGDAIRWHRCGDGSVPAWTYFRLPDMPTAANMGTSDLRDLIVRDWAQSWLHEACPSCGVLLGGAAVEIRDGAILRGWLTLRGEFPGEANYFARDSNGAPVSLGEEEHHMPIRDDC